MASLDIVVQNLGRGEMDFAAQQKVHKVCLMLFPAIHAMIISATDKLRAIKNRTAAQKFMLIELLQLLQ